jgi:hypothetical protein
LGTSVDIACRKDISWINFTHLSEFNWKQKCKMLKLTENWSSSSAVVLVSVVTVIVSDWLKQRKDFFTYFSYVLQYLCSYVLELCTIETWCYFGTVLWL